MPASDFPEAPLVEGSCPFDAKHPPEHADGATPATHFALTAGPGLDKARLLPYARHRWHSRLVSALREDLSTGGADLSKGKQFALVVPPETLRPAVFDALVDLLEVRRKDRLGDCGISRKYSTKYSDVLANAFSVEFYDEDDTFDFVHAAADVFQLCRTAEFMQAASITDVCCQWIAGWLATAETMASSPHHIRFVLQSLSDADTGHPPRRTAEELCAGDFTFPLHPPVDREFLKDVVAATRAMKTHYLGATPRKMPDNVLQFIPPGALPHRVLETQIPCWPKAEDMKTASPYHTAVACGLLEQAEESSNDDRLYIFVTDADAWNSCSDATLCFMTGENAADYLENAKSYQYRGVVLPAEISDLPTVLQSDPVRTARTVSFPPDLGDDHETALLDFHSYVTTVLDLSRTNITKVPPQFPRYGNA